MTGLYPRCSASGPEDASDTVLVAASSSDASVVLEDDLE
jgi:hypothetical protein